jgi:16S rRNA (uracil1498-N3)-methyltransferase
LQSPQIFSLLHEALIVAQLQRLAIAAHQCTAQTIQLTSEQQHYLTRVLRLKEGDRFIAILDQGQWWLAQLQNTLTEAQLIEPIAAETELAQPITLIAALPKGQGFDDVVRMVTELGVTTLIPLLTARTLVNPSEQKLERWRRIATEAAEQSCRQVVPEIFAPISFAQALDLVQSDRFALQHLFISVTDNTANTATNFLDALRKTPKQGILILVGPEGGWTPDEQTAAIAQGFTSVSLGHRVLRAITASIAVIAIAATQMDAQQP